MRDRVPTGQDDPVVGSSRTHVKRSFSHHSDLLRSARRSCRRLGFS